MSKRIWLGLAAALICANAAEAKSDFSGFWVLQGDPMAVPQAASTPSAAKRVKELLEARGLDAPNGSPEYAWNWCTPMGMPWQQTGSLPVSIKQGPLTVSFSYSLRGDPRHIYIDGQPHPSADRYDFTSTGHAIGRWQGDDLLVDTRYFLNGITVIPGGALRTEKSRLTERMHLSDSDTLRITSTWTDPTTLRRPHTYTYVYKRVTGRVWMTEPQCNVIRSMRAKGYALPSDTPD